MKKISLFIFIYSIASFTFSIKMIVLCIRGIEHICVKLTVLLIKIEFDGEEARGEDGVGARVVN